MAEPGLEIAEGLRDWLHAQGVESEVDLRGRATVGLSQETWLLEVVTEGESRPVVLRLPTPSGGAAISTQSAALWAVAGSGVPAPTPLWFDEGTDNPFDRPFLVMERLPGSAPVGWHELDEPLRTKLAQDAIDILARMHAIDVSGTPLAGVHQAPTIALAGLTKLFGRLEPLPLVVTAALRWLSDQEPAASGPQAIVHGDFRMGNLLVDQGRITGVLDWEMAAPGDPLLDLSWCFIPVFEMPEVDEPALIERYAERAGIEIDPLAWHWHRVFGFTRLAFYHLAGPRAFDAGRSQDLRLAALRLQLPVTLERLAATLAGEQVC